MSKALFNEPEMCLVKNWSDAVEVSRSLQEMCEKYVRVLANALTQLRRCHTALDWQKTDVP